MRLLYITNLVPAPCAGPTYSVPKQIEAQRQYDEVSWLNLCTPDNCPKKYADFFSQLNWNKRSYYRQLNKKWLTKTDILCSSVQKPDLIIVEQFYNYGKTNITFELPRLGVPYIIVPRGELTGDAQRKKYWKKCIANFLIFNRFAQNALAIQYLTEQECIDSGTEWNDSSIVIGNGVDTINKAKQSYCDECKIKCIMIGRLDPFHKGIDLLIDACAEIGEKLKQEKCTFQICGPDTMGFLVNLREKVWSKHLENIIIFGEAVYGSEKENLLLNSDVFVITSRFEGHSMAMLEALNYGLPCLATTGSNMRKEVEEYDAGWTADNNVESIREAILAMLRDKQRIKAKGLNARRLVEQYSWSKLAKKSHELYEGLLRNN